LRPRQGHAQHQPGAQQRNFMERWRDWLRQTLAFSTSACPEDFVRQGPVRYAMPAKMNPVLTAK
jgi:hypothetical protein